MPGMDTLLPGNQSAESTERTIVKPKTLNELLRALCLIDEAMLDVDLNAAPDLLAEGKVKIDNYKYLIDEMDLRRESMKRKREEYAKAEKTLENQIKRLKEHLIYAMQANGFEKFSGNEYKCWVQYSESVKLSLSEPNAQLKIHYPDLIKTSYEWKLTPIKQILKKDPASLDESDRSLAEKVREFATITKTPSVRFSVLKDF
jgi:glutamyl-tRNA reductase